MDYEQLRIKTYSLWDLFLHEHQFPYIGRCYASAKREDARSVRDMRKDERDELFDIVVPEWDTAIKVLFAHTKANFASLGNTGNHLHWHLIPRYRESKLLFGIEFIDPDPLGNYSSYPKRNIPLETLLHIKELIQARL